MQDELLHVIGIGSREDWEAGRGSLYWIEAPDGEHALPVFTISEKAQRYWEANSGVSERLQMAEKTPITHQGTLLQNRFVVMPLTVETLTRAAAMVEADYLIRDPRPGAEQEILRLT